VKGGDPEYLPFALPDIGPEEIQEVIAALESGWITTGPRVGRFESDFAALLGTGVHAVAVNSATAGLHLALEAYGIGAGNEVITTTHTFTATADVIRYAGATPVLVDIDLDSYCISPSAIAKRISPRTKAIIPVHFGGHPCDMDSVCACARNAGIAVVEDAAHALPTRHRGRLIGTLESAATVFSFYATKAITTGEGGMLVTGDAELARRARIMSLHGIDRGTYLRHRSDHPSWYYEIVTAGYKYNMTDISAAIGIQQIRKVQRFHARRCAIAEQYDRDLANLPLVLPPRPANAADHAWHLYVVRLRDDLRVNRDEVISKLHEKGIGCSVHYVPLHQQPFWRDRYGLDPTEYPNSQKLYERGISLPIYTRMTDADQERVISALKACL